MVTRIQETREQAIARLAQKARGSGVKILRDRKDGRFYASSASTVGLFHLVTAVACDCKAFTYRAMCSHFALLLVHLGWADEDPEPEPPLLLSNSEPTTCQFCHGQGSTPSTELFGGRRVDIRTACWHCRGTGQAAA